MRFEQLELQGVYLVRAEPQEDERGLFAVAWSPEELARRGLNSAVAQVNVSRNQRHGTLRGLHYQIAPHAEAKLVRCTRGAVYDVAVDVRPESPTCGRWLGVELRDDSLEMLYVPDGFAHGYLALTDGCEVTYQVSTGYAPAAVRGLRYDDPAVAIRWPIPVELVSPRDLSWPPFVALTHC